MNLQQELINRGIIHKKSGKPNVAKFARLLDRSYDSVWEWVNGGRLPKKSSLAHIQRTLQDFDASMPKT